MKKAIWLLAALTGLSSSALASSATWLAKPNSGEWYDPANWTEGGPPSGPSDIATFGPSAISTLSVSSDTHVNGLVFSANANTPYTIIVTPAFFLYATGLGFANDSAVEQTFIANYGAGIQFGNSASTGSNIVFNMNGGGRTEFFGASNAGSASLIANDSKFEYGWGGRVVFYDNSSAGDSRIVLHGSEFQRCEPCGDPFPQGVVFFDESSTASNATLIANGGIGQGEGGRIGFRDYSTGGTAQVKVFGNGKLDIGSHNVDLPGVTIGSLEGDGLVVLGSRNLTIGSNNLSTTFSGELQDGCGGCVMGSMTKIGTGTLTLAGSQRYTGPTTISGGKLAVDGSVYSHIIVENGGSLGGSGTTGWVTVNSGGTVVTPSDQQVLHMNDYFQQAGAVLKVELADADPTASHHLYISSIASVDGTLEVRFANGFLPVTGQVFKLFHVGGQYLVGSFAQIIFPDLRAGFQFQSEFVNGYYQIRALNDGVEATGFSNISTRMRVGAGNNVPIGGFIVTGTVPKRVILRAIGPSLAQAGVANALADPTLELRDSVGGLLFSNDNWMESPQVQEIIDSGIPPTDDNEAAIVGTLAPGNYTAVMRGGSNSTGIGIVEVYDLAQDVSAKLVNISTRGLVETGDNVMIGGFIADNQAMHVMVRALGASLVQFGVPNALADPTVELHNAQGVVIAFNDDWQDTDASSIESTGIPPANDKESAILATLAPGHYTVIVRGQNDTTGVGLFEVYDLH